MRDGHAPVPLEVIYEITANLTERIPCAAAPNHAIL
jgi:hypothetical protein